ncbi:YiiX/YebB-like N1pC/P60 family cysteine hydrolase [Psychromonas sp.]|uniref:YiiX/YebB-like N1pC/P60 family cysteine hydrolase n=1 Tax=Psychromonas sp. TaxID=1884585 RepID=UPI00356A9653
MQLLERIGRLLAYYLNQPNKHRIQVASCKPDQLAATLRKGDVLLVEGDSRFSTAIKYLSQSTWSHAALVISDIQNLSGSQINEAKLLEADVLEGVRVLPLSEYWEAHTRICRPIGLTAEEIDAVVAAAMSRIGHQYDLKNIFDLARYLIQTPPAPARWRRRMLALGSGDPTRAICSSLIAEAFQSIRYPILPESIIAKSKDATCIDCYEEFLSIRHSSLFAPRDFDISPYFQIIKPSLEVEFDFRNLNWNDNEHPAE